MLERIRHFLQGDGQGFVPRDAMQAAELPVLPPPKVKAKGDEHAKAGH